MVAVLFGPFVLFLFLYFVLEASDVGSLAGEID